MNFKNNQLIELSELLKDSIFQEKIFGSDEKPNHHFWKNIKDKNEALHNKFIWYNNKTSTRILMFDDDTPTVGTKNIQAYKAYLNNKNIPFTFLIETDNGYQFGIVLSKPLWTKSAEHQPMKELKQKICSIIEGDIKACHKTLGVWRNPLVHKHMFNPLMKSFSISTLFREFNISNSVNSVEKIHKLTKLNSKIKLSSTSNTQTIINLGYRKGNRHNYISAIAYKILFENRDLSQDELFKEISNINDSQNQPIKNKQILKRVDSVYAYKEKMFTPKLKEKKVAKYKELMNEKKIFTLKGRFQFGAHAAAHHKRSKAYNAVYKEIVAMITKGTKKEDIKVAKIVEVVEYKKSRVYEIKSKILSVISLEDIWISFLKGWGEKVIIRLNGNALKSLLKSLFQSSVDSIFFPVKTVSYSHNLNLNYSTPNIPLFNYVKSVES